MTLLEVALLFCPRAFRNEYRAQIDADGAHADAARVALDVALTGLSLRGEAIVRDVRYAVRGLVKAPLFALVAVGAIALAIAANVAAASVLDAVVLRPLSLPQSQHLFFAQEGISSWGMSLRDAGRLAARVRPFANVALSQMNYGTLLWQGKAAKLTGGEVSGNYFDVLETRAELGRLFTRADEGTARIVISDATWRTYFHADPTIVGKPITLDGRSYAVVGVAPAALIDPTPYGVAQWDCWIPLDPRDAENRNPVAFDFYTLVRARSTTPVTEALRSISLAARAVAAENGGAFARGSGAVQMQTQIVGSTRPLLWLLYAAATVVLLIACANVANLQLARNATRAHELAVRRALGASRRHIVAQLCTEAALIATAGGVLGLALAWLGLHALGLLGAALLPRWSDVHLGGALVVYTFALIVITTVLTGLFPAFSRVSDGRRSRKRVRSSLVVVEVALALALLICAGLVGRSFVALTDVDLGFDPTNLYDVQTQLPYYEKRYQTPGGVLHLGRDLQKSLRSLPGVVDVTASLNIPFVGWQRDGAVGRGSSARWIAAVDTVGTNYFAVLRIPVIRGRAFIGEDRLGATHVAIVSESFAQTHYGSTDNALGRHIVTRRWLNQAHLTLTIVGVVGDVRALYGAPIAPMYYLSIGQFPGFSHFIVRTDGRAAGLSAHIDAAVARVNSQLPGPTIVPYDTHLVGASIEARAEVVLFGSLAAIALLLAVAGIYAVTAYSVQQQTHEFAIRKAVGARWTDIVRGVVGGALAQSLAGVAVGLALAFVFTRFLERLLYNTSPFDAATFLCVIVLVIVCTLLAALIPAIRAVRVDSGAALRYE